MNSKSPKTLSPMKSSLGLSEDTKLTDPRLLPETFLQLFFQQAFILWHFSLGPYFWACHWSHPPLLFPWEKIGNYLSWFSGQWVQWMCFFFLYDSITSKWRKSLSSDTNVKLEQHTERKKTRCVNVRRTDGCLYRRSRWPLRADAVLCARAWVR